ncbi:MAG: HIT domain-containing protein [Myxococcales bacterium]
MPMQTLWAPWRMEYIKQEKPTGCIFCLFPAEANDRENLVLGRSAHAFAMLNKFPYNSGHLMVIPRRHVSDLNALPEEEFADLQKLLRAAVGILMDVYKPEGMNVGMNLGRIAGAGIDQHLHWHAVPRWGGDTNFMPVIGETKVMVEHLQGAFDRLRPRFDALGGK